MAFQAAWTEEVPLPGQSDRYANLPVIGTGMTGLVLQLDDNRVVKIAKTYELKHFTENTRGDMEYINTINSRALDNERKVYERFGDHEGIIRCFRATKDGIELAFAPQGNLEIYIQSHPEPHPAVKLGWIISLTNTFCYVHSRRVFVDEIALRNFLVDKGKLKLADFGQSLLLPPTADIDTICENDLTARIEILHLGWVIYSIVTWTVHKYYYFDPDACLLNVRDIPPTDHLLCGTIIKKCWKGEYANMDALDKDVHALLAG